MAAPIRDPWRNRPGWSEFGAARPGMSGGKHRGYDWYCPEGTPIWGYRKGRVVSRGAGAGPNSFGNNCTVDYGDGVRIVYAHMRDAPPPIDTRVDEVTVIGHVGHTGSAANVIWNGLRHLHEEVFVNGVRVDPRKFHGFGTEQSGTGTSPIDDNKKEHRRMQVIGLILDQGMAESDPNRGSTAVIDPASVHGWRQTSVGLEDRGEYEAYLDRSKRAGMHVTELNVNPLEWLDFKERYRYERSSEEASIDLEDAVDRIINAIPTVFRAQ